MDAFYSFLSRPELYLPIVIWSLLWKGSALWQAASKKQLLWFLVLLVVNTLGLLEIFYVFYLNRWDIDNGRTLRFLEKKLRQAKR